MNLSFLDETLYKISDTGLDAQSRNFSTIKVLGADSERFLNGQLTCDLEKMELFQGKQGCKVDRSGRWQFSFYLIKDEDCYFLICPAESRAGLIQELDKFIIMDDVTLEESDLSPSFYLGGCLPNSNQKLFSTEVLGYPGHISLEKLEGIEELEKEVENELIIKSGSAFFDQSYTSGIKEELINNTLYLLTSVDTNKGCFTGQETIRKIENNRGAAKFPCLVYLDQQKEINSESLEVNEIEIKSFESFNFKGQQILRMSLPRDMRIDHLPVEINSQGERTQGTVYLLPNIKLETKSSVANRVYLKAVDYFQKNQEEKAESLFKQAIDLNPDNSDAYESLGVLLGRNGKYDDAIAMMDKLLEVDPDSVMAHTNKSLYLMKLGKIEEAEEEKSLATVAGFKKLGKEAQEKKSKEQQEKDLKSELERKENMFLQVLELDKDDVIANFGLAEIAFARKNFQEASSLLDKTLTIDPKHTRAKALKAKLEIEKKSKYMSR